MSESDKPTVLAPQASGAKKTTVIIIGGLSTSTTSGIGGIRYACQSLLKSPLSESVDWLPIDSTVSLGTGPLKRLAAALSRILRILYLLISHPRVDAVLIFGNYNLTSFWEKGTEILLSKAFRKRTVLSLRTQIRRYRYDSWFTPFRRWVLRNCDHIICQSQNASQNLVELTGCAPERITVIMNWLDIERYSSSATSPASIIDNPSPVTFVFVGHLDANKAPDVLLQAAKILAERNVSFRLVLCGDGPLYTRLQQDILSFALSSQVELRGWVVGDDLVQTLWNADVFVLPTNSEGMPNALLEAMAAGLPVISTSVSSIPEIVINGENGFLVEPGNPLKLADVMEQMIEAPELRKHMRQNNLVAVRKNHSIDTAWRAVADILLLQ